MAWTFSSHGVHAAAAIVQLQLQAKSTCIGARVWVLLPVIWSMSQPLPGLYEIHSGSNGLSSEVNLILSSCSFT